MGAWAARWGATLGTIVASPVLTLGAAAIGWEWLFALAFVGTPWLWVWALRLRIHGWKRRLLSIALGYAATYAVAFVVFGLG